MKFLLALTMILSLTGYAQADRIKVTEVNEITKPYTIQEKTGKQCYDTTVEVPVNCGADTNSIGIDTLIGGTLGVVAGNQIGRGNGRDAAKIIGGILGATLANKSRNQGCTSYETVTKCNPTYTYRTEQRIVGYNNCAYYEGQKYCKTTKTPLKYLQIKKTITVY